MSRALWLLAAIGLAAAGLFVALFAAFLILYSGDSPQGNTYVELDDRRVDADVVGVAGLAVAVAMLVAARLALRRRRGRSVRS